MRYRLLGPLEVVDDEGAAIALGGPKQRALLAALLIHANTPVSRSRLVSWIWRDDPPPSAEHSLEVYTSRLRSLLGGPALPDREAATGSRSSPASATSTASRT